MAWVTVAGAVMGGGGTFLKGRAGDLQRNKLKSIANTPGLDIDELTGQALTNQQKHLPQAQQLVRSEATTQQDLLNTLAEQSLPGFSAARQQGLNSTNALLAGQIPGDVSEAVQRSGAARALGGGYGGSGMHRNLVARDLGLTSLDLKGRGLGWLQALRGMSPMAQPQNALAFAGPDSAGLINIRGQERAQRMNILAQRAGIQGQTGAWGDFLGNIGGALMGAGAQGLVGGGFGGGMGGASQPAVQMGNVQGVSGPNQAGWFNRVSNYGFGNNWYLGGQPGPG